MLRHYVEILYPGIIVSEASVKPVKSRDVRPKMDGAAFGYRYFDREEVETDGETLKGKDKNHSPFTYFGERMDLAAVKRRFPDQRILISNMEINGYTAVVRIACGQCFPLKDGDVVLPVREVATT